MLSGLAAAGVGAGLARGEAASSEAELRFVVALGAGAWAGAGADDGFGAGVDALEALEVLLAGLPRRSSCVGPPVAVKSTRSRRWR